MAAQAVIAENGRLDWLGVLCSLGCAVHCAAMPLVLATLPSLTSLQWLADPLFHQAIAVVCGVLVARAILPSYRIHRDERVLAAAGIGMALLFSAAFILPDECCSNLLLFDSQFGNSQIGNSNKSDSDKEAKQRGQEAETESDSEIPRFVLISAKGATIDKSGTASQLGKTSEPQAPPVEFGGQYNAAPRKLDVNKPDAGEHEVCGHSVSFGRPLLTAVDLASHLGISGATALIRTQPYLSPLGGLFLIAAHMLNIRHRTCGRPKCCRAGN